MSEHGAVIAGLAARMAVVTDPAELATYARDRWPLAAGADLERGGDREPHAARGGPAPRRRRHRPRPARHHRASERRGGAGALVGITRFEGRHGSRWLFTASGSAVNLAARLAALAGPGTILLDAATAARLGDAYTTEPLAPRDPKNLLAPIEVVRLLGRR